MEVALFDSVPAYKALFASWWALHFPKDKTFNPEVLGRYGSVAMFKGKPVALQYLYPVEDSPIVWIGYTCRDPNVSAYAGGKAIKMLFDASEDVIKKLGRQYAFCTFESQALQKVAEGRGYHGANTKEYWRNLWVR